MLKHASAAAAAAHESLLSASFSEGTALLHAMVVSRRTFAAAYGLPPPRLGELAWAARLLSASQFAAADLDLQPAGTLDAAIDAIEALVAIAELRHLCASLTDGDGDGEMALWSAADRAVLHAAWQRPAWPRIRLPASWSRAASHAIGLQRGRALSQILQVEGHGERPCSIFFGPRTPVALASPYLRQVGPALLASAPERLLALGVPGPWPRGDALPYALAEALSSRLPEVAAEREEANQDVGIRRVRVAGLAVDLVDPMRLHPAAADARLAWPARLPSASTADLPLLLVCPLAQADGHTELGARGAMAAGLLEGLGQQPLADVTIVDPTGGRRGETAEGTLAASLRSVVAGCAIAKPAPLAGEERARLATFALAESMSLGFDAAVLAGAAARCTGRLLWARLPSAPSERLASALDLGALALLRAAFGGRRPT